jgi:Flp pilus assembly protein TadD
VQDAHSLYLETLGELGVIGLALLALPFLVAAGAVLRPFRRLEPVERLSVAGAAATVSAYLVACAVDWMWELPAISIVAFAALAVVVSSARDAAPPRPSPAAARGMTIAIVAVGLLAAGAQGWPLLAQLQIGASQDAARRGDTAAAVESASSAVDIQPWAASPRLQLALVEEQAGRLRAAGAAIGAAVRKSPDDWHVWLVAARIQAKRGELAAARRSLRRARSLNPRSPLFARG